MTDRQFRYGERDLIRYVLFMTVLGVALGAVLVLRSMLVEPDVRTTPISVLSVTLFLPLFLLVPNALVGAMPLFVRRWATSESETALRNRLAAIFGMTTALLSAGLLMLLGGWFLHLAGAQVIAFVLTMIAGSAAAPYVLRLPSASAQPGS